MNKQPSQWRNDLKSWITQAASSVDDFIDIRWVKLKTRFGWDGVPKIQPYIGYANSERVWLHGRVLTNPAVEGPGEDDQWWENIANTYQRFASDEVAGVDVEVRLGDAIHRVTTDKEGYFFINAEHRFQNTNAGLWSTAVMQIVGHEKVSPEDSTTTCKIMTPAHDAQFGVISDVDDTILHTGATRLLTMAKVTFMGNARTRLPLAGASSLYQAFQAAGKDGEGRKLNPIFYISSSPWNIFDLLEDFLELNKIPLGPLLLRDLGFDKNKFLSKGHEHKLEKARNILGAYANFPFILFGDSGQEDAQLYAAAAEEFSDRIKLIFIRDVHRDSDSEHNQKVHEAIERSQAAGVPMFLIKDSVEAANIAITHGLLNESALDEVRAGMEADKKRTVV